MNRRTFVKTLPALTVLASSAAGLAQDALKSDVELKPIMLPKPETDGGKSVLAALKERKTTRNISDKELPPQVLSNLLWAAFGVNRERGSFGKPGRTAASASNSQEIDLYVALKEGVYLYEAVPHRLTPVVAGDFRSRAGRGAAPRQRPLTYSMWWTFRATTRAPASPIAGSATRRCRSPTISPIRVSSRPMFTCSPRRKVGGLVPQLQQGGRAKDFKLRSDQRVLFAQTVGYPA